MRARESVVCGNNLSRHFEVFFGKKTNKQTKTSPRRSTFPSTPFVYSSIGTHFEESIFGSHTYNLRWDFDIFWPSPIRMNGRWNLESNLEGAFVSLGILLESPNFVCVVLRGC